MILAHEDQEREMKSIESPQTDLSIYRKSLYKKGGIRSTQGKDTFKKPEQILIRLALRFLGSQFKKNKK